MASTNEKPIRELQQSVIWVAIEGDVEFRNYEKASHTENLPTLSTHPLQWILESFSFLGSLVNTSTEYPKYFSFFYFSWYVSADYYFFFFFFFNTAFS